MRRISLIIDDQNWNGEAERLFLDQFEVIDGTLHFGIAEEIDAEGERGATIRLFTDVCFQASETASFDADPVSQMDTGWVDSDLILCLAYHAHEVFHLYVGDAGEVPPARLGL